jgi:hypothetical protein
MRILLAMVAVGTLVSASAPARAAGVKGKGGVGGSAGVMKFLSGEEWKDGGMRFMLQAVFKYHITESWGVVLESGWGWNNYGTDPADVPPSDSLSTTSDILVQVIPTTLGVQYRLGGPDAIWAPTIGAGGGLYALGVKNSPNGWAENPVSGDRLTWTAGGIYGRLGLERMFSESASMNFDVLGHMVFSKNEELQGNTGFTRFIGDNTAFFQFRVGANYYFGVGGGGDDSEALPDDMEEGEN